MRFLIREQEYEQLVAAGKFRYRANGQLTNVTETWRMTSVADGYSFLRVDYDERETPSDESTLYHLVLGPNHLPERVKFRHFEPGKDIIGDVQIGNREITLTRSINGKTLEDAESFQSDYRFWFPTAIGLALLVSYNAEIAHIETVTLNKSDTFALKSLSARIGHRAKEKFAVTNKEVAVQRYSIDVGDRTNTLWVDDYLLPIQISLGEDLMATETQYVRYV